MVYLAPSTSLPVGSTGYAYFYILRYGSNLYLGGTPSKMDYAVPVTSSFSFTLDSSGYNIMCLFSVGMSVAQYIDINTAGYTILPNMSDFSWISTIEGKSVAVPTDLVNYSDWVNYYPNSLSYVDTAGNVVPGTGAGTISHPVTNIFQTVLQPQLIADAISNEFVGDFSKVHMPSIPVTTKFPFSLPWDVARIVSLLYADPVCPRVTAYLPEPFKSYIDIDLSRVLPGDLMQKVRAFELLAFALGLILLTRRLLGGAE